MVQFNEQERVEELFKTEVPRERSLSINGPQVRRAPFALTGKVGGLS